MKYTPDYTTKYRRNRRRLIKRGYDMSKLDNTIILLLSGNPLPPNYKDHALKGNYITYRECHVGGEGDWLLIYKIDNQRLILALTETGTHADLFE
ncbi:MAG: type II toxin-antitoxin system YafQ family toxin [Defluviitaleaceae bacterium]|nr:type II toxin-antitoxin system YafQ family toxin [Defluviitaleaceae bacterium]MCL2274926.1 type II toxin-antitoxin system YafQ family toxin [Defluviitaleaceae bacterium]